MNDRNDWSLSSVGLSIRYCRFGAVKVQGSSVGKSCVAGFQLEPAGGANVTRTGRASRPRAHISVAGMFMCACEASMPRYVPSTRLPNTL